MSDKVKEQTIELDDEAVKSIASQVKPQEIDYDKLAEKMAEKNKETSKEKEVNKLATDKTEAIEGEVVSKYAKMSKEQFAVGQLNAALTKNYSELSKMNEHALKTLQDKGLVTKATYLNAGTDADGGYLVPNDELLTDVLNILPEYSSVANLARVINLTVGDGVDVATLTADVSLTEVGSEGGSKADTKTTFGTKNVNVREFAGIAIMTKKLVKQSAVDVYGILRDSFARAIAKKREQLLITDATSGIINDGGVVAVAKATANAGNSVLSGIDISQVKTLPFKVPTQSAAGGTFVISRLLLGELAGREDSTGQPIITVDPNSAGALRGTLFGYPYVVSEVLGTSDAASTAHAVFGNWSKYAFIVRQGAVDSAVFDSGTVDDGVTEHNLINENKLAMRMEIWENAGFPLPGAFAVLSTTAAA